MPTIFCEFKSMDIANIKVPQLLSSCADVYDVNVFDRYDSLEQGEDDGFRAAMLLPFNSTDDTFSGNNAFAAVGGIFFNSSTNRRDIELYEDETVIAKVQYNGGDGKKIEAMLRSLGAARIRNVG